jgi:PAS domain S-box-containing protein
MFSGAPCPSPLELKSAIARDPLIVSPDTKVIDAITQMHNLRSLSTTDRNSEISYSLFFEREVLESPILQGFRSSIGSQLDDIHQEMRASCVLVVEAEQLVGILTEQDVVRLLAEQQPINTLTIRQVARPASAALHESAFTDAAIAMHRLQAHRIRHLPILDESDRPIGIVTHESLQQALSFNGSENRHTDDHLYTATQLEEQNILLAKIVKNETLPDIIETLIGFVESHLYGACCSVMLLDAENRLRHLAAPSLPPDYVRAADGVSIAEGAGSCSMAALRNEKIIACDIANDSFWQKYKEVALQYDLRACWSIPIVTSDNRVLGTLGVYYNEVRSPTAKELELIDRASNIIGIAIEHAQSEQQLQQLNQELEAKVAKRTATLQEQQHFITQVSESTTAILYIHDLLERRNIYSNGQISQILGYSPEEIQAMGSDLLNNLAHPDDLPLLALLAKRRLTASDSDVMDIEYRARHKNGEWRWVYSRDKVFKRTEEGKPWQIIGTAVDISDRKLAEQQLKQLNQELETIVEERTAKLQETHQELIRANRLKDEFLANMSHELRTPLNTILGTAEGLRDGAFGEINPAQIKALQAIDRSGYHLLEIINDILDLAKIESGRLNIECAPVNVALLCKSSLGFIKQQAFAKSIQIALKFPPDLPHLLVDERRIRQALINLLNNAVKFTLPGGRITLEVFHLPQPPIPSTDLAFVSPSSHQTRAFVTNAKSQPPPNQPQLRISVTDTGIGIAAEDMGKLFQPFTQIDSALNRKYEGTGLGLSLVKRIVELHGGQVSMTSEVGVGTCFTIALPCASIASSSHTSNATSSNDYTDRLFEPRASHTILLAEDNEANIETISCYLEIKGYRILVAKNGREAIALAQSEHPDLILMDVQMPQMDGIEAMRQIRQNPNLVNVPIVALTAMAMPGDRDQCLAAGANEYLSKPVKLKHLTQVIQQLL